MGEKKRGNHHNPTLSEEMLKRLDNLKWQRRETWAEFYAWLVPLAEGESEKEWTGGAAERLRMVAHGRNPEPEVPFEP